MLKAQTLGGHAFGLGDMSAIQGPLNWTLALHYITVYILTSNIQGLIYTNRSLVILWKAQHA